MKIFWVCEWEFFGFGCQENTWKKEKKKKKRKGRQRKGKKIRVNLLRIWVNLLGEEHKENEEHIVLSSSCSSKKKKKINLTNFFSFLKK